MSAEAAMSGDTTLTKVFVGGLAWETNKEGVRGYFERFGEILEAVVIYDKSTGRSKGYGFVTFREAEAAMRACLDPYPVIDGRRANCNLAYLGVHRSKQAQLSPYLQPYLPAVGHVHGGSNMNTRAMKAVAAIAGGASFVDHGIQQGIPAAASYNMYSPYFSDYTYQPMMVRNFYTYYQAYEGVAGGTQYQVYNGNGGAAATVPAAGITMADPSGFYNPYYQYSPVSPNAAYSMMQYPYPQMYQYAAVGAPQESNPTAVSGLHKFIGAIAFEPSRGGQAAGLAAPALSAPPTPQYQYRLVTSMPAAAPDQKQPLA